MLNKELLKKIKQIEIKSNRLSEEIFSGEYHSFFRGNGMEFSDIRRYVPGDDIRNIDWKVSARQRKTYVKQFMEERELNFFLMVDLSQSNTFSRKRELVAELCAVLSFSAVKNGDKVGSLLFTDEIEKFIPLKKGKKHALSLIENLLDFEPENNGTNIKKAVQYFSKVQKRRSIVFIISDFFDTDYEKDIQRLSSKHDVILLRIKDEQKEIIPSGAVFTFVDSETGEEITVENMKQEINLESVLNLNKNNLIELNVGEDYVKKLSYFFSKRR